MKKKKIKWKGTIIENQTLKHLLPTLDDIPKGSRNFSKVSGSSTPSTFCVPF